jgi:hypothetical protein
MSDINNEDQQIEEPQEFDLKWNDDIQEDIDPQYASSLRLFPRDWTVQTIVSQIEQKNIDLNPKFQRRNAWSDTRRSKLIESLILGIPVPEVMLAENPQKPRTFLVIDGKQRLLTLSGFMSSESNPTWDRPKLTGLTVLKDLNGLTYEELKNNDYSIQLQNATIRCSVISNYDGTDVLYDIFYRLNTGSVPLSSQELRQVLSPGPFADSLIEWTNEPAQAIHKVLGLNEPDKRLRDVELVLRFISFYRYSIKFEGNLKEFLDKSMANISAQWDDIGDEIRYIYTDFNEAIYMLINVLGNKHVGKRYTNNKWEARFNKVLFEVEVYYFIQILNHVPTETQKQDFIEGFKELCANNDEFRRSIDSSTKDLNKYRLRFKLFKDLIEKSFNISVKMLPLKD